jgi:hypothetical protein
MAPSTRSEVGESQLHGDDDMELAKPPAIAMAPIRDPLDHAGVPAPRRED